MLCSFRSSRLAAVLAVVALTTTVLISALPLVHGLGEGDVCSQTATGHDPAAHHISKPAKASEPHCPICHWWQSMGRFKGPSLVSTLGPFVPCGLVASSPLVESERVSIANRPARAPPVL